MYRIIVLIASLMLSVLQSWGTKQHKYSFHRISIAEGLTQASVQAILLDTKGTLWIGTQNGLNKYAQQVLKTFYNRPEEPTSIPHNRINHILEDSIGTIWLSTSNGIATHNYQGDEFTLISRSIAHSATNTEGGILFGGDKFILRYDHQQKNLEHFYLEPEDSTSNPIAYRIQRMIPWKENKILVGTRQKGIYLFDTKERKFTPFITNPHQLLLSLYVASNGYIFTSHYGEGVFCYDSNGKELYNYRTGNSALTYNYILDITEHDGNIWVATDGRGINLFPLEGGEIKNIQQVTGDDSSLPDNSILTFYKDKEGNLWAGSVREGIFIIKINHIRTFKGTAPNTPFGLSDKTVISLYEDTDGEVWIGTDGGGVNRYSPHTNRFTHYPNTFGDKITSITEYSDEDMLVSIYTQGMFLFNKKKGTYQPFVIVNDKINNKERNYGYTTMAYKVNEEKIYIFGLHSWCHHLKDKTFTPLSFADPSISPSALRLVYANDTLALITNNNYLYIGNLNTDTISLCFEANKEERIKAAAIDKKHRIWLGTDRSFGYYDMQEKKFHPIYTGLFDNVSAMTIDAKDRVWICGQNMLFTYDIIGNKFVVWNASDGYTPNEILSSIPKRNTTGTIYWGGTGGLVQINPQDIQTQHINPKVILTNLFFNGASCQKRIKDKTIRIPWNYHSLSASVQTISQDIFQKSLIRYIIRTNDTERQYESYDNTFNLTTLVPGKYYIWASCNRKDGTFTEPEHLIDIIITPPWYKSVWFFTFLAFILIALSFYLLKYFNKRKEEMMKEKLKIYKQRINEDKINFLINVNHELRTPLTLIYAPLKRLAEKSDSEYSSDNSRKLFNIAYNQALRMKNIINMVLDMNRLESGTDNLKMERHDINQWVKRIANDFSNLCDEKKIHLAYQLDEDLEPVWFDEWKCQIVFSNLLSNAIKFCREEGRITLSTQLIGNKVRVSIADQGIGLKHLDIQKLFTRFYEGEHKQQGSGIGLSYAKTLIELHGGNINAFTNDDQGATFLFELPIGEVSEEMSTTTLGIDITDIQEVKSNIDKKQYKLLVVEDETELREYLQQALAENFGEVFSAPNAIEALEICRKEHPSLIISDIMMPGMDGYEFCRQVKDDINISHIPVILLTARTDENSIKFGYKQGADFYMSKPFDMDFLQTIICNLISNRELKRQSFNESGSVATPQEATISQRDESFLIKLNELIRNNLETEDISIDFLTDHMAMSRASLYNKVKVLTGLGVNDYINRIRIEKAVELLTYTDKPINDIASEVGFTYPRYFSTLFKKIKGVTPTQFKESLKD